MQSLSFVTDPITHPAIPLPMRHQIEQVDTLILAEAYNQPTELKNK